MKISRNSWHYRFQDAMELYPETRKDFCSYWRGLVLSFILTIVYSIAITVTIATTLLLAGTTGTVFLAYFYPGLVTTYIGIILSTLLGGLLICLAVLIVRSINLPKVSHTSIITIKYNAIKNKTCYKVDFE